jgi:hypothetical protein
MGFEPMGNGFAGRRVSHFATGAHCRLPLLLESKKPVSALLGRAVNLNFVR